MEEQLRLDRRTCRQGRRSDGRSGNARASHQTVGIRGQESVSQPCSCISRCAAKGEGGGCGDGASLVRRGHTESV